MVNIIKEMLKALFFFELKLKTLKMHHLHLNQTCFSVTVSPDAFIHKYDIWLKCFCIHNITFQINIRFYMKIFCNWKRRNSLSNFQCICLIPSINNLKKNNFAAINNLVRAYFIKTCGKFVHANRRNKHFNCPTP